jgi:glycosyltransferase involved in cell wall biosynthesis
MKGIITHNEWKKEKLITTLSLDPNTVLMERNAVDVGLFQSSLSKKEAREKLGISMQFPLVAVYTGHLYRWKGAHVFAEAAQYVPNVLCVFVGGRAQDDLPEFKKTFGDVSNIYITGQRPHHEIPLWQKAADVLVLPNSGKKILSTHYTSPMKLFEYMASERPIVATSLPSIKEITKEEGALLVAPDDPRALATGIQSILDDEKLSAKLASRALLQVKEHTWQKRAGRILSFVNQKAIVE